jgi:uncharacterized phage protein gp47/JayE
VAFQIKNFVSIAAAVINHMRSTQTKITDFTIGSVARTLVEAPSIEMDELYQQMFSGLKEAIPTSVFNSFNFGLLPPTPGAGVVAVTIATSLTATVIPAGSVFSTAGSPITLTSSADVTIPIGATVGNVPCVATTTGAAGNLPAGTSFSVAPTVNGFVSAVNATALSQGRDLETNDQRKRRFNDFITTLQRGTIAALVYGAKLTKLYDVNGIQTEGVATAQVIEPYVLDNTQPIALVNVFIHNGVGSTSGALITAASTTLYGYTNPDGSKVAGWKAAGVPVNVYAATETPLDMTGVLTCAPGYVKSALAATANAVMSSYELGLDIGQTWLYAEAITLVMAIPGVTNFVLSAPTADQTAAADHKIMPGTVAVTAP